MKVRQGSRLLAWVAVFSLLAMAGWPSGTAQAQRVAKYGADFLSGGVGARALGMHNFCPHKESAKTSTRLSTIDTGTMMKARPVLTNLTRAHFEST